MNSVASRRLDLYHCTSVAEVLRLVKDALTDPQYDEGGRLVCINLRLSAWPDRSDLTIEALDALSPKPIVIIANGYHSGFLNTPALAIGGYTVADFPNGQMEEGPAFAMWGKLQETADVRVLDQWVADEAAAAARLGVTEVVDLEMEHNIPVWQRRIAGGFDKLRVHIGFYAPHLDDAISAGLKSGDAVPDTHGLVLVGPHKLITDGSLGSQTAYCCDPYPGTDNRGLFVFTEDKLAAQMAKATTHGLKLAVHAIGDEAMHITLKTFKAESDAGRRALEGSTIEHAQLVSESDIPTFAELGLIASVQPRHMVDDRELCHTFWPGREGRTFPFRWFVDAGIPMKLGTDCPVAPLQPWEAIAVAISRAGEGEDTFCPEHLIELEVAYRASTHNGRLDIVEGDRADLVVLDRDPLVLDAAGLRQMVSRGTMLGGNWTYRE
jgi:predicted amidohydrolase YtcJ